MPGRRRKRLPHGPNWRARLLQAADAIRHARKSRDVVDWIDLGYGDYEQDVVRERLRAMLQSSIEWTEIALERLRSAMKEEPPL